MKLRDIFTSKTAAVCLAASLMMGTGTVFADEAPSVDPQPRTQSQPENIETAFNIDISDPHFSYGVVGGVGGLFMLLSLYGLTRKSQGGGLRCAMALAVTGALLNPAILIEDRPLLPTEVAVIVDRSASQTLDGRDVMTQNMQESLLKQLGRIEGVKIHVFDIANDAAGGTNLFGSVKNATADIPPAQLGAVFVLTDGQVHDTMMRLPLGDTPLHAFVSGRENEQDRRIVLEEAPAFGVVGEDFRIKFRVVDEGVAPTQTKDIKVTVSADDTEIATQIVTAGQTTEMVFKMPHGGKNMIEVHAEMLDGELTETNNRIVLSVEGIRERMNVLLMSGAPQTGNRMFRDILKSDPAVDLAPVNILRPDNKTDETPLGQLSVTGLSVEKLFAEKLENFALVIFDRWHKQGLLPDRYYENIASYVEKGGAVLVVNDVLETTNRGIHTTPMARILPVMPDGSLSQKFYKALPTEIGQKHPVTRNLVENEQKTPLWGSWLTQIGAEKVHGEVIMEGSGGKPLVVLGRKGEGRVAEILSPDLHLWARGFEGGGPYQEMIKNISHWLLKEPALEEEALRIAEKDGDLVITQQTLKDVSAPVTLVAPSGKTETVTLAQEAPGLWTARMKPGEKGLYRAEQGERHSFIYAGTPDLKEWGVVRSTTELLRPAVTESGGYMARMEKGSASEIPEIRMQGPGAKMAGDGWLGIRKSEAGSLQKVERIPLFSGLPGLSVLLLLYAMWAKENGFKLPGRKTEHITKKEGAPLQDGPSL
ncbi:MAG: hypothetical protein CO093_05770 [Alphaproteobacteria bacterium CG_4_9_14_3_um_filter_47_13]|nr:MAG: hypothetical protein CO093_05770 [Alphaproteobacteria bacterium CG_4_9_14_3_um_filter_47_13]